MKIKYPQPIQKTYLWAFMQWTDIPSQISPGNVYLRRLRVVQTPWFGVYLHWIQEPDLDRYPHDHPWRFWSFIVRGGYCENFYAALWAAPLTRIWDTWSLHSMKTAQAHQITAVSRDTITLVLTSRRIRTWCFWTDKGLVPWHRIVKDDDEVVA